MALTPGRWTLGVLLGCALILIGTSGNHRRHAPPRHEREVSREIQAAIDQRGQVGWEITAARSALFFLTWRDSLRHRIPADSAGGLLLLRYRTVSAADSEDFVDLAARYRRLVGPAPALRAGVVFIPDSVLARLPGGQLLTLYSGGGDLLPGVTDGRTCLLLATPRSAGRLERELGLCAYYAAFGVPGPHVRDWLQGRRFGPTLSWNWTESSSTAVRDPWKGDSTWPVLRLVALASGNLPPQYHAGLASVACLQGSLPACRETVLDSPRPVPLHPWVETYGYRLAYGMFLPGLEEHLLSDMAHDLGPDRFRRFWQSPLPVDSALQAAAGVSLDTWTGQWVAARSEQLRAGPAIAGWTVPVWLLLVALVLTLLSRAAERRQVR